MRSHYKGTKTFSVTHTHATAAKAEQAAPGAGKRLFVTDIAGSTDKDAAILLVKEDSGGAGDATLFQLQVKGTLFSHRFETPLIVTANKKASVEIDGTTACKANISGFIL